MDGAIFLRTESLQSTYGGFTPGPSMKKIPGGARMEGPAWNRKHTEDPDDEKG